MMVSRKSERLCRIVIEGQRLVRNDRVLLNEPALPYPPARKFTGPAELPDIVRRVAGSLRCFARREEFLTVENELGCHE